MGKRKTLKDLTPEVRAQALQMVEASRAKAEGRPALTIVPSPRKAKAPPKEPADRDGLIWMHEKKQIKAAQAMAGLDYRSLFRHVVDFGGADVQSCLNALLTSGGGKGGAVMGGSYSASAARAELFRIRWIVLGGQTDLLTVMDGVCGMGHTIAFLVGPTRDRMREEQLKASLRIALDLLISDKAVKKPA